MNWNMVDKELKTSVRGRGAGMYRLPGRPGLPLFGGQVVRVVRGKGNLYEPLQLGQETSM